MIRIFAGAVLALLIGLPAHAATITDVVSFSDDFIFRTSGGQLPPYSHLQGSFTVAFDPYVTTTNNTSISLNSLNVPGAALSYFDYTGVRFTPTTPIVGHPQQPFTLNGGELYAYGHIGADELLISVTDLNTRPRFNMAYIDGPPGSLNIWTASTGSFSVTDPPSVSPVPLPAALPMFAVAVLGLSAFTGARGRRGHNM